MKEFSAQTGGRYTYADDLENLQDLALAFSEIFDDCDAFIISGCGVSGSTINSGYIYLNGKIRYFSGATGISAWPQYLYEVNTTEDVNYADTNSKVGRVIYGCAISSSLPTKNDDVTGKIPATMTLTSSGGKLLKDAFIGKYALLLNAAAASQTVNGPITFNGELSLNSILKAAQGLKVGSYGHLNYDGTSLTLQSAVSNTHKFVITPGGEFKFYVNGTAVATIGTDITFTNGVSATTGTLGSVKITGSDIFQTSTAAAADLYLNRYSYNGGTSYYRNTYIGNGKGSTIVTVNGSSAYLQVDGKAIINNASSTIETLVLKSTYTSSNVNQRNSIVFKDSDDTAVGYIGYTSTSDKILYITNTLANVKITGSAYINLGPKIYENGMALEEKYVLLTTYNTALALKAAASDVYTKTEADSAFATPGGGFTQFVNTTNTKAVLRTQIEAVASSDLDNYAKLSKYLSDMATSDTAKATIRKNIGCLSESEIDAKISVSDTGWKQLSTQNSSDALYARQIGNIVSVQGTMKLVHSGTAFTIPSTIDAPSKPILVTVGITNDKIWTAKLDASSRTGTVVYCNGACGNTTNFSFTYMV